MSCRIISLCFIALTFVYAGNCQINCTFAPNCDCSKNYQTMKIVECLDATEFPTFADYDGEISHVIVEGNFTFIPANAFFRLHNINYGIMLKRPPKDTQIDITIDPDAFRFYRDFAISLSFFSFQAMSNPPTASFQNVTLSELLFDNAGFFFLEPGPFIGLSVYIIRLVKGYLVDADTTMLDNVTIFQPTGLALDFSYTGMNNVPPVVQVNGVTSVDLSNNFIESVLDYTFVCPLSTPCTTNNTIREIDLSGNPIRSVQLFGTNAFANLPNLASLSLRKLSFTTIPTATFLLPTSSSLTYLDLEYNQLTNIPANCFSGFTSLANINFNGNPISNIDIGAFDGLDSMTDLVLVNLGTLYSVDLLITSGMKVVQTLNLAYGGNLSTILLSDPSQIPDSLQLVDVSFNNITFIERNISVWLNTSTAKVLDISHNSNVNCTEDIAWMGQFVICNKIQILTNETYCMNEGLLSTYLANITTCVTTFTL